MAASASSLGMENGKMAWSAIDPRFGSDADGLPPPRYGVIAACSGFH